jgi:hypothetical protein
MADTFVVSGSRAGIGSVVIIDGGSGDTFMVAGVGADNDPSLNVSPSLSGVAATGGVGSFSVSSSLTIIGVQGTSGIGSASVSFSDTVNASLSALSLSEGAITLQMQTPITGLSSTSHIGTVVVRVPSKGFFHAFP